MSVLLQIMTVNDITNRELQNKRPMGHIAHLRKQFQSINAYDYIKTLIMRRKNPIPVSS